MIMPKILFVCLGNICRSPTAEAVMRQRATGLGLHIESAGTGGWHIGDGPDPRSVTAGQARGYSFAGQTARQVAASDFERFDYILAMDSENLKNLRRICPLEYAEKLELFLDYSPAHTGKDVPDPYYGGPRGFDNVIDLIESACDGLIAALRS